MCDKCQEDALNNQPVPSADLLKEKFEIAMRLRNFEIDLFWKRSLFFWGFIASTFVAYAALVTNDSEADLTFAIMLVSFFGLACSIGWYLVNRGSKFWQENWETKQEEYWGERWGHENFPHEVTRRCKDMAIRHPKCLFFIKDPRKPSCFLGSGEFSVSQTTIFLSLISIIVWLALSIREAYLLLLQYSGWISESSWPSLEVWGVFIFIALFALTLFAFPFRCRSSELKKQCSYIPYHYSRSCEFHRDAKEKSKNMEKRECCKRRTSESDDAVEEVE